MYLYIYIYIYMYIYLFTYVPYQYVQSSCHRLNSTHTRIQTLLTYVPYRFLSSLENTKWLLYISQLLAVSLEVVAPLDKEELPVLVHCSDGWDRTPQVVALAKIILDPHYRTIEVSRCVSYLLHVSVCSQ